MLNIIWPIFIIVSFIYGIFSGSVDEINNSIFDSAKSAVELTITFFRNSMFMEWNNANSKRDFIDGENNENVTTNYEVFISKNKKR